MIVTFALQENTGEPPALDRVAYTIASVRRHIPQAEIIQLTNAHFPDVSGVDAVIRYPFMGDFIDWAFSSLIKLCHERPEPILQIATDILIQKDVSEVFAYTFDVASCKYPMRERPDGVYCGDVNFIQPGGVKVFEATLDIYRSTPWMQNGWDGGQKAFLIASQTGPYNIKALSFNMYCATPESQNEDLSHAAIVHFRGDRKRWMIPHALTLSV